MAAWRWINVICGALLAAAAVVSLIALATSYADASFEDVWLSAIWLCILGPLVALCLANAALRKPRRSHWLVFSNGLALVTLIAVLVIGRKDPALVMIAVFCCIGPASALCAIGLSPIRSL